MIGTGIDPDTVHKLLIRYLQIPLRQRQLSELLLEGPLTECSFRGMHVVSPLNRCPQEYRVIRFHFCPPPSFDNKQEFREHRRFRFVLKTSILASLRVLRVAIGATAYIVVVGGRYLKPFVLRRRRAVGVGRKERNCREHGQRDGDCIQEGRDDLVGMVVVLPQWGHSAQRWREQAELG